MKEKTEHFLGLMNEDDNNPESFSKEITQCDHIIHWANDAITCDMVDICIDCGEKINPKEEKS